MNPRWFAKAGLWRVLKIISLTSSTDSLKQDTTNPLLTTTSCVNGAQVDLDTNKLTAKLATEH